DRDIDLDHMLPRLRAGLALALLRIAQADRVAYIAVALADAAALLGAVAKLRQIDLRQRDRDILAPLAADHHALRHVLAQILFDLAPHDLAEAVEVTFDTSNRHTIALSLVICPLSFVRSKLGTKDKGQRTNLVLGVAAREDAGHVVEHVGRALVVIAE